MATETRAKALFEAHEGEDYACIMQPDDTTETAILQCRTGDEARDIARRLNSHPVLLAVCKRAVSESVRVEYEEDGPACAEMAYEVIDAIRAAIAEAEA